jgi:sortase A
VKTRRALSLGAIALALACFGAASWIHIKAFAAQELIGAAWNRAREGATDARPWPWADTTPVARLTMRGESFIVLEGASGRNLAFGPTHDAASVMPGDRGNSVIAAHRDTHFRVLQGLRLGDRLSVERKDGRVFQFSVTDARIADSRHERIALGAHAPRLTLVTCFPFDAIQPGGPLRFVVTADWIAGAGIPPPQQVARAARSNASPADRQSRTR